MLALGLDAITYAPGILAGKQTPEDMGRAFTLNRVLRRLYPEESYSEASTIPSTHCLPITFLFNSIGYWNYLCTLYNFKARHEQF